MARTEVSLSKASIIREILNKLAIGDKDVSKISIKEIQAHGLSYYKTYIDETTIRTNIYRYKKYQGYNAPPRKRKYKKVAKEPPLGKQIFRILDQLLIDNYNVDQITPNFLQEYAKDSEDLILTTEVADRYLDSYKQNKIPKTERILEVVQPQHTITDETITAQTLPITKTLQVMVWEGMQALDDPTPDKICIWISRNYKVKPNPKSVSSYRYQLLKKPLVEKKENEPTMPTLEEGKPATFPIEKLKSGITLYNKINALFSEAKEAGFSKEEFITIWDTAQESFS